MEKEENIRNAGRAKNLQSNCGVNSTFNFTMGAISVAVAGLIGYFAYQYFLQ
jgi:hypothetical protein